MTSKFFSFFFTILSLPLETGNGDVTDLDSPCIWIDRILYLIYECAVSIKLVG